MFWCPGVSKDENNWFWSLVMGSEIPKSEKWGVLGSPISKSTFHYSESKQNNSPELLNLLFEHMFHKNAPKVTEQLPIFFLLFSQGPRLLVYISIYNIFMSPYDLWDASGSSQSHSQDNQTWIHTFNKTSMHKIQWEVDRKSFSSLYLHELLWELFITMIWLECHYSNAHNITKKSL